MARLDAIDGMRVHLDTGVNQQRLAISRLSGSVLDVLDSSNDQPSVRLEDCYCFYRQSIDGRLRDSLVFEPKFCLDRETMQIVFNL